MKHYERYKVVLFFLIKVAYPLQLELLGCIVFSFWGGRGGMHLLLKWFKQQYIGKYINGGNSHTCVEMRTDEMFS